MRSSAVPDIVVGRLPLYLRALTRMQAEGKEITSSQELGERLGISSAQIRKDLSQFGEFGKQVTHPDPRLSMLTKLPKTWLAISRLGGKKLEFPVWVEWSP